MCPLLPRGSCSSLLHHGLQVPGPLPPSPTPAGNHSVPRGRVGSGLFPMGHSCQCWALLTCPPCTHPPGPAPGHRIADTYSAFRRWESRVLQSSSARRRASLRQASCRELPPCTWAIVPRPWAVATPGAELQRATFPEKQSRDESVPSPVTSFHPNLLVEPTAVTEAVTEAAASPPPAPPEDPSPPRHCLLPLPPNPPLRGPIFPFQILGWGTRSVCPPDQELPESRDHIPLW